VRLVLSASTAAAALYGVVVLLGPGPVSPAGLGGVSVRQHAPVHLFVHDRSAQGPVQREPQPSTGPARYTARVVPALAAALLH
jgi:hypothetical protein